MWVCVCCVCCKGQKGGRGKGRGEGGVKSTKGYGVPSEGEVGQALFFIYERLSHLGMRSAKGGTINIVYDQADLTQEAGKEVCMSTSTKTATKRRFLIGCMCM